MSTDKPYDLYQPSSSEISKFFFAGYEAQIDAGLGVVYQIIHDKEQGVQDRDYKILLFGMPGTGKSSYPKALTKRIWEDPAVQTCLKKAKKQNIDVNDNFSLFYVRCVGLINAYTDTAQLKIVLSLLEQDIDNHNPAIVVLDELDAFSPEKRRQSEFLAYWTMNFMQERHGGLAIVGILNFPGLLDPAVYRQFQYLFHFDLPDENTVAEILKYHGLPFYREIARRICKQPVDSGELKFGCEAAIQFKGNGDRKKLSKLGLDELSNCVEDFLKTPWEKVRDYMFGNDFYLKKARRHLDFWINRKETLTRIFDGLDPNVAETVQEI